MRNHLSSRRPGSDRERGMAILVVLLVLLSLLVMTTPFLMTARNASRSSTQLADRVQSRLALDAAERHARAGLGGSHPAVDATPYWDDLEELAVEAGLDRSFLDPTDPAGVMWKVEVGDEAGKLDLNSAGPHLFANLIGGATRLTQPLEEGATEMTVSTTRGFPDVGFLWVGGSELVGYTKKTVRGFGGLQRGLMAQEAGEGEDATECGPQPAETHEPGSLVLDERAFGPVKWRTMTPDGLPRSFDAPEQVRESALYALAGLDDDAMASIQEHGTVYGGVRAGRRWQRPARLVSTLQGGLDCELVLDQRRWFGPGTTVQITDGVTTELGIVQEVTGRGIRLMMPTVNDYEAYTAEVRALARRPVNVNVAEPETLRLLLENLQLRGINERVTGREAEDLAALIVASRPFEGFEDFLRRVLLPAAGMEGLPPDAPVVPPSLAEGSVLIDEYDAVAIYANALNANDSNLAFSTQPFAFTSRDVYSLDLRTTVNAPSGVARVTGRRDQVELVAPQTDLLQIWARQEDFAEAFRLDCEAPWWSTGPEPVTQWEGGAVPPSLLWPEIGTLEGKPYLPGVTDVPEDWGSDSPPVPQHVFPAREEDGYAEPWVARVSEVDRLVGHVEHFDNETRDHEGRFLPDRPETYDTTSDKVAWADPQLELLHALDMSLWIKPDQLSDGVILDIGQDSLESDRITLALEGPDLVLRVLDAVGDHPATPGFREAGEARMALAQGDGPGLAADTWSHVFLDVRGTRPDQITMLVDGRSHGVRQPGLSRLTSAISETTTQIQIDDAEGFPQEGVARIGREFVEYVLSGNVLDCRPIFTGAKAGFGGRFARVPFEGVEPGVGDPNYTNNIDGDYPAGTPVEVYGYTIPLASNVPSASASLPEPVGRFAVAVVTGAVGGNSNGMEQVTDTQIPWTWGRGLEGKGSQVSALTIGPADDAMTQQTLMDAFHQGGGYAALVQRQTDIQVIGGASYAAEDLFSNAGSPLFGVEIVYYSGHDGSSQIQIARRAALPALGDQTPHAFVVGGGAGGKGEWTILWVGQNQSVSWNDDRQQDLYLVPISIPAPGAQGGAGFLTSPNGTESEFAQITYKDTGVENTEWVRYDTISSEGHLVRNGFDGLNALAVALTHGRRKQSIDPNGGQPPPPTPVPPGGPTKVPMVLGSSSSASAALAEPPAAPAQGQTQPSYWQAYLGAEEADEASWPRTRAARSAFQFRGVFGTYQHDHPAGTVVLPVWRVDEGGFEAGWPGRNDPILVVDEDPTSLGWPGVIHRAWRPHDYTVYGWGTVAGDPATVNPASNRTVTVGYQGTNDAYLTQDIHVALQEALGAPVPMTPVQSEAQALETRMRGRILKHPSGERPRIVQKVVLGGTIRGASVAGVTVDEVCFQSTDFGTSSSIGQVAEGGHLVLRKALADGGTDFELNPDNVRLAGRIYSHPKLIGYLPEDAALLRIGEEIVCIDTYDADTGFVTIAPGGRGMLGTTEQPHPLGSQAVFLESQIVSNLSANIDPGDDAIPIEDTAAFPQQGTVLIDDELIHYTRVRNGVLEMPRRSDVPGAMNRKGDGIFRGRYGTIPTAHSFGAPVILFPMRYWDRHADLADGPELSYFGLSIDQPNAFWKSVFFDVDEVEGAQIEVLQRAFDDGGRPPPPWDADPETTPGLDRFELGTVDGEGHPLNFQADRLEWRVYVRHAPGSFDPVNGLSHGWKRAPRLRVFGVEYVAPNQVLRRIDE